MQAYFPIRIRLPESSFLLLGSEEDDNFLGRFSFVGGRVSSDGLETDVKHKTAGVYKLFLALSLCQVSEPSTLVLQPGSQLAEWLWPWLGNLSTYQGLSVKEAESRRVPHKPTPESMMAAWRHSSGSPVRSGGVGSMGKLKSCIGSGEGQDPSEGGSRSTQRDVYDLRVWDRGHTVCKSTRCSKGSGWRRWFRLCVGHGKAAR